MKGIFSICFFLISHSIISQSIYIGPSFGLGESKTDDYYECNELFNFKSTEKTRTCIDLGLIITPHKSKLSFISGICYQTKGDNFVNLNYLCMPIIIRFDFGKVIKIHFGGGLYGSLLINYENRYSIEDIEKSKNNFDVGGIINTGLSVNILKYRFFVDYRNYVGSNPVYIIEKHQFRNYFYCINLGFLIKIKEG